MKENDQEAKRKRRKGKKRRKARERAQAWRFVMLVNICTSLTTLLVIMLYFDIKLDKMETRLAARMDEQEGRLVARMDGLENRLMIRMDGLENRLMIRMDGLENKLDGQDKQIFALAQDVSLIKGAILGLGPEEPEPGSQQSGAYQSGAFNVLPLLPPAFVVSRAFWEGLMGAPGERRPLQSGHGKTMLVTVGGQRFLAVTVPAQRFSMSWTQACDPHATRPLFGKGQGFLTWSVPETRVKVFWPGTMEYQAATPFTGTGRLWHGPLENPPSPVLIGQPLCP